MSFKLSYRKIALIMVKNLPVVNDDDFSLKVEYYIGVMRRLPPEYQAALKAAYVIASKAPPQEREDLFQEYYLAAHKAFKRMRELGRKIDNPEAFALNAVTGKRRDIWDYINAHKRQNNGISSLSCSLTSAYGNTIELGEILPDNNNSMETIERIVDAERILQILPSEIKKIALKRINGEAVSPTERDKLSNWHKVNSNKILEVIK